VSEPSCRLRFPSMAQNIPGGLSCPGVLVPDARGDLRRLERGGRHIRPLAQRIVQIDQAGSGSGQQTFGGDMVVAFALHQNCALLRVSRRHGHMAALAGKRNRGRRTSQSMRRAKTSAGPDEADGSINPGRAAPT
jgi:hypothetical protein